MLKRQRMGVGTAVAGYRDAWEPSLDAGKLCAEPWKQRQGLHNLEPLKNRILFRVGSNANGIEDSQIGF